MFQLDKGGNSQQQFTCIVLTQLQSRISQDSAPNGPSISTVGFSATADDLEFFRTVGWWIVKTTSGGIDKGARPICDGRCVEEEKDREEIGKAGRRNEGREIESGAVATLSNPLARAVESIVNVVCFLPQRRRKWKLTTGKDYERSRDIGRLNTDHRWTTCRQRSQLTL